MRRVMPFPDQSFDLVFCQQGLQFFSDRDLALSEMRRVFIPGGRVAISVWQQLSFHPLYEALFKATACHLDDSSLGNLCFIFIG